MIETTDETERKRIAKRKILLRRIGDVHIGYALKKYWPLAQTDWAALGAFAQRRFLPPWVYESLYAHNSWYLNLLLCANPDTPVSVLRRMIGIKEEDPLTPEILKAQAPDPDPSSIKNIARAALLRRL